MNWLWLEKYKFQSEAWSPECLSRAGHFKGGVYCLRIESSHGHLMTAAHPKLLIALHPKATLLEGAKIHILDHEANVRTDEVPATPILINHPARILPVFQDRMQQAELSMYC